MMPTVISLINLKGGVGKTTTTIALADFLALQHKKKVLVIDLDPQTNVTVSLIHQDEWQERDDSGRTLKQLFLDAMTGTSKFEITDAIIKDVSNIKGGIKGLDLLPSSLDLIDIQDRLAIIPVTSQYTIKPTYILKKAIEPMIDDYDIVLIDCPPNLGTITLNGILLSNFYLIPTIPDILSTYGIPQITKKINDFTTREDHYVECLGILVTKYRSNVYLHNSTIEKLETLSGANEDYPALLETRVPMTVRAEESADYDAEPNTLKQKYGQLYDVYTSLVNEIKELVYG